MSAHIAKRRVAAVLLAAAVLACGVIAWISSADPLPDVLVGAHYYPWYHCGAWSQFLDPATGEPAALGEMPTLGRYDSRDPAVISQHIEWAVQHGVDFFVMSWWGPGHETDNLLRDEFLQNERAHKIRFAIQYESVGRLATEAMKNGEEDLALNLDVFGGRFVDDIVYAAEAYFNHPQYLRVGGRPVVFLYAVQHYVGDLAWVDTLRSELGRRGHDAYIVADVVGWNPPRRDLMRQFDAVTAYNMFAYDPSKLSDFALNVSVKFAEYRRAADEEGVGFVPSAIPGYDDRAIRGSDLCLPRSPELFRELLRIARR